MQDDERTLEELADEVDDLAVQLPDTELAELLEQRAHNLRPGESRRAALLSHAGERWEMADDLARARACYEEAVRDGGAAWIDPRASLASVLIRLEDPAAEDLVDELRGDLRKGPLRGPVHEYVGEALEMQDRLEEALRWFNSGVTHVAREDPEELDVGSLNGRYRVRRRLAMPRDRYDELCEERRTEARAELEALREERRSAGPGEQEHASEPGIVRRITLLHWQPEELETALQRWPSMSEHHGSTYPEHKAEVEGHCRELSEAGITPSVGKVSVEEFLDFAQHGDRDPAALSTRAAFAAHLGYLGRTVAWPPGRNDPCWCGSGKKYKKCCGGLRFPAEDE
jgi:hypothetical protein